MHLEIRAVTERDLDGIARLEALSFPAPWRQEFFRNELLASGRYNRVALDAGGQLTGYLFSMYILDEMHVNKIAVIPQMRRQGIARALMEDCFSFARAHQITSISLEVRESNDQAIDFYRSLAFAESYRRKNYYPDREAAVVMSLHL